MDIFTAVPGTILELGKIGTNETRAWRFPVKAWLEDYPDGVVSVLHQRSGDAQAYPVSLSEIDGEYIYWTITSADVADLGYGVCELVLMDTDDHVAKSIRYRTRTEDSLTNSGTTPPDPEESWVESVLAAATTAVTAKNAAQAAQTAAETAQGKAEDAQEAAEIAQGKAEDAQDAAEDAQEAAETAQGKAEDAQEAAEIAQGKAEDAQEAAETAQGKAEDAQEAAEAAQDAAEDAQEAAEAAQAAAEAVLESIPPDYSTLSAAVAGKLDKPSSPGSVGQVPRIASNGVSMEWATVGQPTDAQTAEAVSDWLDDHPEATTTVEDFSLTANKLVKGTLGWVIPQQFGAKGDGVTDDSQAVKDCCDYAMANNYAVYLPMGTYVVTHSGLSSFTITDGKSLVIVGSGQNSIIKRKDNSLPEYTGQTVWAQIFTVIIGPQSSPAHDVIFANFCIDSNRRNQENATSGYTHEASMDISIRNSSTSMTGDRYLDRFIVSNMRFYDPVADCVNVSGTSQIRIKRVIIDKMIATDRHGTRNDIGFTACPMGDTIINNCMCGSIHFEFNYVPSEEELTHFIITGCTFDYMSLASRIHLVMQASCINKSLIFEALQTARINNCSFNFTGTGSYIRNVRYSQFPSQIDISDSVFTSTLLNNSVTDLSIREGVDTTLTDCRFNYVGELNSDLDDDGVNDHVGGWPISREGSTGTLTFDNCYVDPVYSRYVDNAASKIVIKNCKIENYSGIGLRIVAGNTDDTSIVFDNVEYTKLSKRIMLCSACSRTVKIDGEVKCTLQNFDLYFSDGTARTQFMTNMNGSFRRHVLLETPFTFEAIKNYIYYNDYSHNYTLLLFNNDVFEYVGANKELYPSIWISNKQKQIITTTGATFPESLFAKGNACGLATQRPTCLLSQGFQYFDTDLKLPLTWDGTKWINADGTSALNYEIKDGTAARVETDVEENAICKFIINFMAVQSGSGDPSGSNIRPFSGWTECTLYQTGENIITTTPLKKLSGATVKEATLQIIGNNYYSTFVYPVPRGTLYAKKESSKEFYYGTTDDPDLVKNDYVEQAWYYRYGTTLTFNNEHKYLYASGTTDATYADRSSLSYESASSSMLEAGTGESYQIAFSDNDTVFYGGYVDVLNSTLVQTHGHIASYAGETLPGVWMSDRDVYAEDATPTTGAEVVYELAEPVTTQLTDIEFELNEGINTLWSDTNGNIRVEYWKH